MRKGTVRDILSFSRFWYQSIALHVYDPMVQTRVQYLRQKPNYSRLNTHGSPIVQKQFFEIRAPLAPLYSCNDVTFNNSIYRSRAPSEGLKKDKGAG